MGIVLLNENVPMRGHVHRRRFWTKNTNSIIQDLVLSADIFLVYSTQFNEN